MGELMSRALIVEDFRSVDRDTRTLALLEAAEFKSFSHLMIERNFFTFTRNADFLFRFFEELSGELVELSALDSADTYGDFAEHISILSLLQERYRRICMQKRYLEPMFIHERYRLNRAWIRSLETIEIEAEGYLTNFELKILNEIALEIPVVILFDANRFNRKMQEKFRASGLEVESGFRYRMDLGKRTVLEQSKAHSTVRIESTPFSERLLQAAFVKQKVYEMIREGIDPERIAVVLPDERFAPFLRRFDSEANFNFAMGESLSNSRFVSLCEALMRYAENRSVENALRIARLHEGDIETFTHRYNKPVGGEAFNALVAEMLQNESDDAVRTIVENELFHFQRLLDELGDSPLRAVMHLFVNRLKERSIDDVRGGKVTVMGVLETRACTFEGVIIVDFNEAYVPHRSDKDLFINSAVRERAGLPGTQEREALQKLFYHRLMQRAKKVSIAYVSNETVLPSRFLKELNVPSERRYSERAWAEILLNTVPKRQLAPAPVEGKYDFASQPLSATGLKVFLECRRKFYHRYVEKLAEHKPPREMPEEYEIGNALHHALRMVYTEQRRFENAASLKASVAQKLAQVSGDTELERYLQQVWLKRLEPFFEQEAARFRAVEVVACERQLQVPYLGMTLTGQIDRIDRGPDGLEVLDYKSGSYPLYTAKTVEGATDFQLEFYHLLASQIDAVSFCGYYDLNRGNIVREPVMALKFERLTQHLESIRSTDHFVFEQTEDLAKCRFCAYVHLCARELS